MKVIYPPKLKPGDGVRIIAPSSTLPSMPWLTTTDLERAKAYFTSKGYNVSEAKHLREADVFGTASIEHRLNDLHDAFGDPSVQAMITIRGGWHINQLLSGIDYDVIRKHPKILCGFSDITALQNAIFAKTGLVTYSGPNFSQFCVGPQNQYTYDAFEACVMRDGPIAIQPSKQWTDDRGTPERKELLFEPNEGWWVLQPGKAEGRLLGANLCTLQLLHGTECMPELRGSILFIEDDEECLPRGFDRDLQSLIHQPGFDQVRGIVIGRFQKVTGMTRDLLAHIIKTKAALKNLPVIANVDFGHTKPMITFPIGGEVRISAKGDGEAGMEILKH